MRLTLNRSADVSADDTSAITPAPPATGRTGRSPKALAWARLRRDRVGMVSGAVVLFFFVVALAAPLISAVYGKDPYTLYGTDILGLLNEFNYPVKPNGGIDGEFWLGIEPQLGRDVLTQLLYGIRTSLLIAAAVVVIVTVVGSLVGIAAGYLGGRADFVISRIIEVTIAFPSTLLFIAVTPIVLSYFVASDENTPTWMRVATLVIALSLFGWTRIARLLRGQVLSLRESEYIKAAKVYGASPWRIVTRELLPNLWTPILVFVTLDLPAIVTSEAALSFLGVGIQEPTPDWGRMIKQGASYYLDDFTFMAVPGVAMIVFVVAFNLFGDSVRDALDPKSHR
ncbi:ABC transporter permease [Streptomyces sp. NBC_00554]|uniref:ABC transporter permease n=1 Tax=Streptomyces sp. NBC_00554 TaxID=2903661 RepID=UPI00352E450F|nr:ABC transporter permease [Streptomyces sp. NBC_00554]